MHPPAGRGVVPESVEEQLPRDRAAGRRARSLIEQLSGAVLDADELDRAKLAVSELVNNAVLHGRGTITLRAILDENRLLVEVIDEGSGFERVARTHDLERFGGWGLNLVEAEADRWGIHEGTTHVWFEIERPGPRLGSESKPAPPGA
jgi:anti-sigma regulatory factor (Ser/Thr protein kinase)